MAQGHEVGGPFRGHDPREPRYPDDVALAMAPGDDEPQGVGLHADSAPRDRDAMGGGLRCDVHHPGAALRIEMGQCIAHRARDVPGKLPAGVAAKLAAGVRLLLVSIGKRWVVVSAPCQAAIIPVWNHSTAGRR